MNKIAIFASGSGTNAENIIHYFRNNPTIKVECIASNVKKAKVLQRARKYNIDTLIFDRKEFYTSDKIVKTLKDNDITHIVLAGFLWLVPENMIKAFEGKIINIHPALLPKYGGKGMYGAHVHETVIANSEKESGITIHYVNPKYDEGNIIFQATCIVEENETPESLAEKVHRLEYLHYPRVIENIITGKNPIS
jgi:phosphoribosylglycinamide formyltransferase 1